MIGEVYTILDECESRDDGTWGCSVVGSGGMKNSRVSKGDAFVVLSKPRQLEDYTYEWLVVEVVVPVGARCLISLKFINEHCRRVA